MAKKKKRQPKPKEQQNPLVRYYTSLNKAQLTQLAMDLDAMLGQRNILLAELREDLTVEQKQRLSSIPFVTVNEQLMIHIKRLQKELAYAKRQLG